MLFLGCSTLDSEIFHSCPQVFIKLFSELHIDSYLSIVIFKQNYFLIRKSGCEADELRKKFSSRKKTNIQGTRGNKTMENVMFCSHLVQNFIRTPFKYRTNPKGFKDLNLTYIILRHEPYRFTNKHVHGFIPAPWGTICFALANVI